MTDNSEYKAYCDGLYNDLMDAIENAAESIAKAYYEYSIATKTSNMMEFYIDKIPRSAYAYLYELREAANDDDTET